MEYHKTITLKDGRACTLRNGTAEDGQALLKIFNLTHTQTDYLLTYPEEHSYTAEDEAELLRRKTDSADEIELLAFVDGAIVGSAGVTCVARKEKVRHRAEFGISVDKAYWGLGIVSGLGVIENDFHNRKDLTPNVCAVYTEADCRCQGIAGRLLNMAVDDMRAKGISPLYLVTDHIGFYERYGWEFLCMVQGDGEPEMSRMYIHR